MFPQQSLFRAQAIRAYTHRRGKTVVLRSVAPPVFLCGWLLLGLLMLTTVLVWQASVPVYTTASGVLLPGQQPSRPTMNGGDALLFVPAHPTPEIHVGASLTLQVILTGRTFIGTIAAIAPNALTPEQAREQYALTGDQALVITEPSVVVQVWVGPLLPGTASPGSSLSAQVPVGEESLLSRLPHLLDGFLEGNTQ